MEVHPDKFYGEKNVRQEVIENIIEKTKNETSPRKSLPSLRRLLGPSQTWKVFRKQYDALEYCVKHQNGLMCFAFEDINNSRMFLVAHPKVFWASNYYRFYTKCNTYEVIREFVPCKLYLDIEFDLEVNPDTDGERMLNNFQKIINFNLNHYFGIQCSKNDILDLDSSSSLKFSRHIIYQIKSAFRDNYTAGNFLKQICGELKAAYESNLNSDDNELSKLTEKYDLLSKDILELFTKDKKNKVKLFVDEGVYTKNRHFRILGSSKKSKKIPLCISKWNEYQSSALAEKNDCSLFLDSLVTYFSWEVDKILDFGEPKKEKTGRFTLQNKLYRNDTVDETTQCYSQIDAFINNLVFPNGRVRKKTSFNNSSRLIYEIQGFRYCENIKKEHKSNNIFFVVDLRSFVFYQKCYDSDCNNFRSNPIPLPDELRFYCKEDNLSQDNLNIDYELEDEFKQFVQKSFENRKSFEDNVADDDLCKVVDCVETILDFF